MKSLKSCLFIILFFAFDAFGQVEHLYKIEAELMKGNQEALVKIAGYFDSSKNVVEYLGYHRIETTESLIAKRIAEENCAFTAREITISPATSTKEFLDFLKLNKTRISFSPLADAFLLTPLEDRNVEFEIVEISAQKKQELTERSFALFKSEWVLENGIDYAVQAQKPDVLLKIASLLYKSRNRYNRYIFNEDEYIDLLRYLTGTTIAVRNEKGEFSYHIDKDYHPESKLNLLIFFAKYYKDYVWSAEK